MSENTDFLIKLHLSAVVPLMIADLSSQGGITDWHLEQVQGHAVYLGEHGDAILYRVPGQSGKAMHVLCECLAVLAFAPGGVTFAGMHFEGKPEYQADLTELDRLVWLDALMPTGETA